MKVSQGRLLVERQEGLAQMVDRQPSTMEHRAELKASSINDLPDSAFAYIEPGGSKDEQGKTVPRSKRHFPIHDAAHVRNALARAPQSPFGAKAMPKIRAAAKKFGIQVADERSSDDSPLAPIEFRAAEVAGVNFAQRIVELVAVPYEQEAIIEWRGGLWTEMFARGSFDGIEKRPNRVRVNRDHDKTRLVGKALAFHPSRQEGLVTELRIADTPLGQETLQLAHEDILSASIEFGARMRDQDLDKSNMTRRIRRAYLDAIAMVPDPAYNGAQVLSVRHDGMSPDADLSGLVETPALDELAAWMAARRR